MQALRRKAQSEADPERRKRNFLEYKKLKAGYKRKVLAVKNKNFVNLLSSIEINNIYGSLYRSVVGKTKKKINFGAVKKEDGSLTTTKEESIHEILKYHFKCLKENDTRETVEIEHNYTSVTEVEVEKVIRGLKSNKATGLDGIPNEIVRVFLGE